MSTTRTLSTLLRDADGPYGQLLKRTRLLKALQIRLESILGPDSAGHCRIQNLREGTLILQTDAPSWAARLRFELPRLLQQLKALPGMPQINNLEVRVVPHALPLRRTARRARLSREAAAVLESAAATTVDPQLREALRRLSKRGAR